MDVDGRLRFEPGSLSGSKFSANSLALSALWARCGDTYPWYVQQTKEARPLGQGVSAGAAEAELAATLGVTLQRPRKELESLPYSSATTACDIWALSPVFSPVA